MTKVSVVVPVYNPGPYLEPCVASLLKQTMPAGDLEVVFVDDGSTDDSPDRLDVLAAEHEHITVLHQENSGWPGQPRNRGTDAARGEYVFFCDQDDWFAPQALQRLYDFATANGSDVVLPKMGGVNRTVPHHAFRTTQRSVRLTESTVMDSLTPHKLFRRAFLLEQGIRFPEGRRRLEDHLFVVTAYLLAETISIYGDYTCYSHISRDDKANAGFQAIDWQGYFANLAEAIAVVESRIEPGSARDHVLARWLRTEIVQRVSGRRLLTRDPENAGQLVRYACEVAAAHFGPGVVELLPPVSQPVGRAVVAGDETELWRLAELQAPWGVQARLLQVGWSGQRLQLCGTVEVTDRQPPAPPTARPSEAGTEGGIEGGTEGGNEGPTEGETDGGTEQPAADVDSGLGTQQRFEALLAGASPTAIARAAGTSLNLDLTDRRTGARWFVPATLHHEGLTGSFTAEVDLETLAAGRPLPRGLWDLHVQFSVLGLGQRRRLTLTTERRPTEPSVPAGAKPRAAVYFTAATAGLTVDVGLTRHPELRPAPAKPPAPTAATSTAPAAGAGAAATSPSTRPGQRRSGPPAPLWRRGLRKVRRTLQR